MLFGMFFGAGNLIFPAYLGRQAGSAVWPAIAACWLRASASAAGSCRHRHHPQRRPACPEPKGEPPLRPVLYLRAVSDHRPVFRDSALRHRALHPGRGAAGGCRTQRPGAGAVFIGVLHHRRSVFTASGQHPHLDRAHADAAVPAVFRRACGNGAGAPRRLPPTRAPGELPLRPLLRRLPGGIQHHGRAGRTGLWHRGGQRHPRRRA